MTLDELLDYIRKPKSGVEAFSIALTAYLAIKGNNIDDVCTEGVTLLMYASYYGHEPITRCLLEKGALVDEASKAGGITALFFAARKGNIMVIKSLLIAGAHINQKDSGNCTALGHALIENQWEAAELLIRKGAKISDTECLKQAEPVEFATRLVDLGMNIQDVAKYLIRNGEKFGSFDTLCQCLMNAGIMIPDSSQFALSIIYCRGTPDLLDSPAFFSQKAKCYNETMKKRVVMSGSMVTVCTPLDQACIKIVGDYLYRDEFLNVFDIAALSASQARAVLYLFGSQPKPSERRSLPASNNQRKSKRVRKS